jgi:hypothetical protein
MDQLVDRALPYWSILLNILLSLIFLPNFGQGVEYGRRFASAVFDLAFGAS